MSVSIADSMKYLRAPSGVDMSRGVARYWVGKPEVEAAIAFAKIVVQAVYQYTELREQLAVLKKADRAADAVP